MAMTPYEDLLPLIQPHASSAPIPVILSVIQRVVGDFCLRSGAYRFRITGVPAIANVPYYDLPTPVHTRAVDIILATFQGSLLRPTSDVLAAQTPGVASPHSYVFESGKARIISAPERTIPSAFEFIVALQPTMQAPGIDEVFIDNYYHDITMGVLAELLMAANQPWSNPQLASNYVMQYNMGIANAKARANADHTAKVRTTRINWF